MSSAGGRDNTKGVLKRSLKAGSYLQNGIESGLRAMSTYSDRVREGELVVTDSLDLDEATKAQHGQESRWDYILGVRMHPAATSGSGDTLVGVEVHSATDGEIGVIIKKKRQSKPVLQAHLRDSATVSRWVWIASGSVRFSPNSKHIRRLRKEHIEFVGSALHL